MHHSPSINHCDGCGVQIPLRRATETEPSECWECKNCGAVTLGVFDEASRPSIATNVAPRRSFAPAGGKAEQIMRLIDAIETCIRVGAGPNSRRAAASTMAEAHGRSLRG